ncbi:MAG: alpha/beta hydrolase, partial [Planctomycetota bacterium]
MTLHPQAQAFVDSIRENPPKSWSEMTPEEGRAIYLSFREFVGPSPDIAHVHDAKIGGVECRVYDPKGPDRRPIAYFHGGGWVLGCIDTHDALCRNLATGSGRPLVSVNYRRAPEHRYPAALDDCFAVCEAICSDTSIAAFATPIQAGCVTVVGDSAGGNLAAAVAIKGLESEALSIDQQILIYPVIDADTDTDSYQAFADGYGLTAAAMRWFWQQYLGEQSPTPLASPAHCQNLERLPAALIVTAEYDVLRDEAEIYARRLSDSGVAVDLVRYPGMLHAFVHLAGLFDEGKRATA